MTLVVAEMGACHDGSLDKAVHLIETAKVCGADVVKAQYWEAETHAARRHAPDYLEIYRRYQVPLEWLPILRAECDKVAVAFGCSVSEAAHVPLVAPHVEYLKIPSFESQDLALTRACRYSGRSLLISFGGGQYPTCGTAEMQEYHLLCVAGYPTHLHELNLNMFRLEQWDGFSDHSGDIRVGAWAVMAGAQIIEAHLKLQSTDPKNPDAGPHALEPTAFKLYVDNIRDAELALGDGVRKVQPSEEKYLKYRVMA